ncbi:MAG: hypothetical protein OEX02_16560, partial [Cyclobacteriaceae bacterium]|nr:hypothetical protein [Cyclobacteriaceae bacterium]
VIYNSRGTKNFSEGEDIRYITSGNNIYVASLAWPGTSFTFTLARPNDDSEIKLLGYDQPLEWHYTESGTTVILPTALQSEENRPCKYAFIFKMEGNEQ